MFFNEACILSVDYIFFAHYIDQRTGFIVRQTDRPDGQRTIANVR